MENIREDEYEESKRYVKSVFRHWDYNDIKNQVLISSRSQEYRNKLTRRRTILWLIKKDVHLRLDYDSKLLLSFESSPSTAPL